MLGKRRALFYSKLTDKRVRCELCPWNCMLEDGRVGLCRVRKNIDGELYTLNYGIVSSMAIDPIEKKPLFHFHPGTPIFSISTFGCNFKCPWCQNWEISQAEPSLSYGTYNSPENIVSLASKYGTPLIAYTYNEPLIWYEFILDTARLAKKEGLMNVLVTNGHINIKPLETLAPFIDAANVDIKAFNPKTYLRIIGGKLEKVLEATEYMKNKGIHVETTYLVVPGLNDSVDEFKSMVRWHLEKLGEDTPLHISRFFPHYKYLNVEPTPTSKLEEFWKIAKEMGLKYVYVGNLPGHKGENTYCPSCKRVVIARIGFMITGWNLTDDMRCKFCGEKIDIRGKRWEKKDRNYWWMYI